MTNPTKETLKPTERVIKISDFKDAPHFKFSLDEAAMFGSEKYFIMSHRKAGNIIKGPLTIGATPDRICIAGMWKMNPLLLSGFPSTTVTPIPVLYFDIPAGKFARQIAKEVTLLSMLFAGG